MAFYHSLPLRGASLLLALCIGLLVFCPGCRSVAAATTGKTFIYVANTDAQSISVLQLNSATGKATRRQEFAVAGAVMPMALSPTKKLLYAALRSEPYQLLVLAIDPASGTLTQQAAAPFSDSMANLALDRSGRYLLAASYAGNHISIQPLDHQGLPQARAQRLNTGAHPHQISADPSNQFVYVSLLGEDRLDYYRVNARVLDNNAYKNLHNPAPLLQAMADSAIHLAAGSGPRHFVFSAQQPRVYLVNEMAGSVQLLQRHAASGALTLSETYSLLPASEKPWAADIHLTPDEKFLYVSERRHHRISGFAVEPNTGRLTPVGSWPVEQQPRAFAITPDSRYLVAAGQLSNHISIYAIDAQSGQLKWVDRQATGANPSWITIVSLAAHERDSKK